nr:lipopolysaccharide biosynthesis protein [Cellulosimicrobium arenosum]
MVKDYAGVLGGRVLAALLQALTFVLLARAAGPGDFGLVVATTGATTAVSAAFGFGFGPYLARIRSLRPDSTVVGDLVRQNNRTSVVLGAAALVAFVALGLLDPRFWALAPLAPALVAQRSSAVWQGLAVADERTRLFGAALSLRRLVLLVGLGLLLAAGVDTLLSFAIASVVSESSVNLFLRRRLASSVPAGEGRTLRPLVREAVPFWIETIAGQLRNLDVLAVTVAGGTVAAGMFAAASRVSSVVNLVPSTLATVLMPRVSRYGMSQRRATAAAVTVGTGFMAVVLAGIVVLAPWAVPVVLGDAYTSAVPVLQVYCCGLLVLAFVTMINAVLQGAGLARVVGRASMIGAAAIIVGVAAGAATGGAVGASIGYSAAWIVQLVVLAVMVRAVTRRTALSPEEDR